MTSGADVVIPTAESAGRLLGLSIIAPNAGELIEDLLEPVAGRPGKFWRGYDVYDAARIGFVTQGPEAERIGTPFDISLPGNSNVGHTYGTQLPPEQKRALLEYLKTL